MTGIATNIIEDCKKGKRKAQNQLYSQYCDAMYNICLRMLKNQADAEDILQQSFCDVFRKLHQYRMEASIGAWIKRIVINNCLTFLRSKKPLNEWDDKYDAVDEASTIDEKDVEYSIQNIKRAMTKLSTGYRVIITLYLFEGLDHLEIADHLEINVSTSKTQYHRAKKKLLQIMKTENL